MSSPVKTGRWMPSPLLTHSPNADCLVSQPCGIRARVMARAGAWWLDQALAGGTCPDESAVLSLRAHRLIGLEARRTLARELRDVVRRARCPRHPFDTGVRICASEVLRSRDAVEALADRLEGWEPVEPAGVARVRLLLRDGVGPLYNESYPGELRNAIRAATEALEPRW
ncbi:MAG TPA: hypothetical protein VFW09_00175 [Solirubrobacteraceae bacterium]|nr:hypothetical protein [Solirubrobacteraceae bacterium]